MFCQMILLFVSTTVDFEIGAPKGRVWTVAALLINHYPSACLTRHESRYGKSTGLWVTPLPRLHVCRVVNCRSSFKGIHI